MGVFEQILQLPYAYIWLPGAVFFLVVAALYWITRPAPVMAEIAAQAPAVAPVATQKPIDQRGARRRQGNTVEVHIAFLADQKEQPQIGSVLDRSVGGMRLALFRAVEVGVIVSVRPIHVDDIVPWVELEIRSCRPSVEMPDRYDVGCQYVKSPPYSIQLLFG